MPPLTKEQLDQIQYVSIQDYCQRVDQLESLEDKLAFSTRYILSHGKGRNANPDHPIDHVIKVAQMKIADKSADIKTLYQSTKLNEEKGDRMVDPNVSFLGDDFPNELFLANPVEYLKGEGLKLEGEIKSKDWKSQDDIAMLANLGHLRNDVFTEEFGASLAEASKKPTAFALNARLENIYGGPRQFKKALDATKPGVLSRMFGTRSVEARNLDEAYKSFSDPNNAFHGDLETVRKAATEYLHHALPNWNPEHPNELPKPEDLARLKGTKKARAEFSVNLLKAAKEQGKADVGYTEMIETIQKENLTYGSIPAEKMGGKIIVDDKQADFQNQLQQDVEKDEKIDIADMEQEGPEANKELENEEPSVDPISN